MMIYWTLCQYCAGPRNDGDPPAGVSTGRLLATRGTYCPATRQQGAVLRQNTALCSAGSGVIRPLV